jgi:predicted branched-subunit amino acid permease
MSAHNINITYLPYGLPRFTREGTKAGLVLSIPYSLGIIVFGMTAGVLAAKNGFSLFEAILMNGFVYAGASQLAALAHWPLSWTLSSVIAVSLLVGVINSRFILMSASLYPYFRHLPLRHALPLLYLNTDFLWLLFLRDMQNRKMSSLPPDLGFFFGCGIAMWVVWTLSAIPGWWAGNIIDDLKKYGLDLFALMFFASLLVPMWKGVKSARPWLIAALVALIAQALLPGSYYIVIGALSGGVAGAFFHDS